MTTLKILSFNVRGLASRLRRINARFLLRSLQEHKLREGRLSRISTEVWPNAHWRCAQAAEGVHALRNLGVAAGKGGVALGISLELAQFVSMEGNSDCNRAVWVGIIHPVWGRIGFVGVNGPNDIDGRVNLWRSLRTSLDSSYRWALMGDFNMIEDTSDQWGGSGVAISGREWRAWAQLTRQLALLDSFNPRPGHLRFSWDTMRSHRHNPRNSLHPPGNRVLRRLDRIYFSQGGGGDTGCLLLDDSPGLCFF